MEIISFVKLMKNLTLGVLLSILVKMHLMWDSKYVVFNHRRFGLLNVG